MSAPTMGEVRIPARDRICPPQGLGVKFRFSPLQGLVVYFALALAGVRSEK